MAAVELDDNGYPIEILNAVSHIHDSGVDPNHQKRAETRLAVSGVARRTRRMFRRRRARLQKLDKFIARQGWPLNSFEEFPNPQYPWLVRAELASKKITDEAELAEKLSVALRHIARHRGWRNPYIKAESLTQLVGDSDAFVAVRESVKEATGLPIPEGATVGQVIALASNGKHRLRGESGLISARLQQTDHARELKVIFETQGLSDELFREVIKVVFDAESPKGSAAGKVGHDALPGQTKLPRAAKASDAFQRYRIVSVIGNLRLLEAGKRRPLATEERTKVFEYLVSVPSKDKASWDEVAELLGVDRGELQGTAAVTDDGERVSARPPIHETNATMRSVKLKSLAKFWKESDEGVRAAILRALSNSEAVDSTSDYDAQVDEFLMTLSDEDQALLDTVHLPAGRAAYSEDSLRRLTKVMLEQGVDLSEAREIEFGVPGDWKPPAPRVGEPVGNPAVDRVLKTVARWLDGVTARWGEPERVTIEHVRDAFTSKSKSMEIDRNINRRAQRNESLREDIRAARGLDGPVSRADMWRFQSVTRQNGQCAYCGTGITMANSEMDHIVPRAGQGSTNTRDNLLAVCHACNSEKGKIPFAVWAEKTSRPGVSVEEAKMRLKFWERDLGMSAKDFGSFKLSVMRRLQRATFDEEMDARSIESVAWMANELRARIAHKYALQAEGDSAHKVQVFAGAVTAEARKASGIEKQLEFIGGTGKTRLDRRHHAVDAAVVSLMSSFVAQTLGERMNIRFAQQLSGEEPTWKQYQGADYAHQEQWRLWIQKMQELVPLLQEVLDADQVPVTRNLRLRLGNSRVHEDSIRPLVKYRVGEELSSEMIDRASSEALWCALTRDPDYDFKKGLPANPERTIRVNGTIFGPEDEVSFFPVNAACVAVRGGCAELGSSFHHARIYRVPSGKKVAYVMLRVYALDLQRHRDKDLFNVELPPQTMSVRKADPKLRKALAEGTAEYLGWIVVDDELLVDTSKHGSADMSVLTEEYGKVSRWTIEGFFDSGRLRLRPAQLSSEGLSENSPNSIWKLLDRPGWLASVNKLFENSDTRLIRRDSLGNERVETLSGLPVSWSLE
ncbi:CRISPR-associated protein [Boudabousia marimammalium]|uniref:CRISPR-associated protein n=2 Tax=Boudabousia marimammalium TaxID=156892 RepID=A0A1Q5PL82_9ACTO|nr:CRISPR-associated protein [Boudabousia marimammalium]